MTRIGNVDHVLMLLQQQLQKLNSTDKRQQVRRTDTSSKAQSTTSMQRVASLSAKNSLSDEQIERALLRALLVDELGEAMGEDYRFDRVVSEVYRIICDDEKTRKLLQDALEQARGSA